MKKQLTQIVCTTLLAVLASPVLAQLQRVEAPADLAGPSESPETAAVAMAQDVLTGIVSAGATTAGRALIIPKEAGDPKEFVEIEEDLNVMARILEKAASGRDEKSRHAMGIAVYGGFTGSSPVPKNLYIQGYGALFFLNVNFPLLPPASKTSETEAKVKTSTEWEEARRELYRPPGVGFDFDAWRTPRFGEQAEEYEADRVEELKRDLVAALKNATHIRKLNPDETVTVVVSGRGSGTEGRMVRKAAGGGGGTGGGRATMFAKGAAGDGHGTRLIVRARKADMDALQKEKISLEDFRKKVTTITY